jgi:hypothetical protein
MRQNRRGLPKPDLGDPEKREVALFGLLICEDRDEQVDDRCGVREIGEVFGNGADEQGGFGANKGFPKDKIMIGNVNTGSIGMSWLTKRP